ncbi:hypothetical protein N2601_32315 (plasmid) [Rhizobium sp. CB3060]|uniref:hypothetical protein n=1 Tax=Rhizobium sp. CB3060 TaxID=3138255 RepID=UPI0021A7ABB2|nr:hypothetical protein [Rhizobium tropici]UWU26014.1 hypothetical protein N2601_32315 [Rhizobium tropici]
MSDIDFLKLYADAAALRIDVLVSRLECNTALEKALHDYLENFLAQFINYTREALAAERRFVRNTDPTKLAELDENFGNHRENYEYYWCETRGNDLWDYVPLQMAGFRRILRAIHRKLGISIDGMDLDIPEEWGLLRPVDYNQVDLDPDCYEDETE